MVPEADERTDEGRDGSLSSEVAFARSQCVSGGRAEEGGLGCETGQGLRPSQLQQWVRAPHQHKHRIQDSPANHHWWTH